MRQLIPAYEFRRRARVRMKPVLPILVLVALIATLPSLISSTVMLLADANPTVLSTDLLNRMLQVVEDTSLTDTQVANALSAAQENYYVSLENFLEDKGPILCGLLLFVSVLGPVLNLGLINAYLHALRKEEFTPAIALSRMSSILRVLGLYLLIGLKLLAWMLPGIAASIGGVLMMFFSNADMGLLLILAGLIACCVMGIMATYRYAMSIYFMADDPTMPIRECIRRSKEVMKKRKMELFSLEISFIGWYVLLRLAQDLLIGLCGAVIGQTLGMFAALFLTVYTGCAMTAFYQAYACGREDYVEDESDTADTETEKMTD